MTELAFEYLEIRPCVRTVDDVISFPTWEEFREAEEAGEASDPFFTLYGRSGGEAHAIGDFTTFEYAQQIMWAIYSPLLKARTMIEEGEPKEVQPGLFITPAEQALSILEDAINQCSNEERL
jgi:hypothetical protein